MRIVRTIAAVGALAGIMTSGVALASGTRAGGTLPAAKAPTSDVRSASRMSRVSNQAEGEAVAAGTETGTIVFVGGVALIATAAGIWAIADNDEDDAPFSPGG